MEARLKISIGDSQLEIEGSESLVEKMYSDFKELLSKGPPPRNARNKHFKPAKDHDAATDNSATKKSKGVRSGKAGKGLQRLDINLRPSGKPSLKDFVAKYASPNKDQLYLLCVNYLDSILGIKEVTVDHIYTCLDELGERVPTYLKQVLINTKNDKGWIDIDEGKITTTIKGQNHLKLDIAKA